MPKIEISIEQQEAVAKWVRGQGGTWVTGFRNGYVGSGIYQIDGDPLVTFGIEKPVPHSKGGSRLVFDLYCSGKNAQMLGEAGIVNFASESQQGAQTP